MTHGDPMRHSLPLSLIRSALAGLFLLSLSGCVHLAARYDLDADLIAASYEAADGLVAQLNPPHIRDRSILVTAFADIDDVTRTSTFGRTVAEYVGDRFIQLGFQVTEMRVDEAVFVRRASGELVPSPELREVALSADAQVVLTGTYSAAEKVIYVSARMIDPADSTVFAAHGFRVVRGENNRRLLKPRRDWGASSDKLPPGPLGIQNE